MHLEHGVETACRHIGKDEKGLFLSQVRSVHGQGFANGYAQVALPLFPFNYYQHFAGFTAYIGKEAFLVPAFAAHQGQAAGHQGH